MIPKNHSMRAQFCFVEHDQKHNIVFLEDIANLTGGRTITNDAEEVIRHFQNMYGSVRVVYRDTDGEWWEIVRSGPYDLQVKFQPWHGLVWDQLSRAES